MAKVRLSDREVSAIKETAKDVFGEGTRVILFGSRVDLSRKGGDIDLYIIPADKEDPFEKKLKFLVKLKQKIGDRKIDVVIQRDPERDIEKVAMLTGVEL